MKVLISLTPAMQLLKTDPGLETCLRLALARRWVSWNAWRGAEQLVPAVKSRGGKPRYAHTPQESNQYLKWAFVEAANGPAPDRQKPPWQPKHITP